ncbi:hypothetical protein [Burkholderia stagnalis]|uniref:Uncharacterized protein n=1 Tax=Burkholderia stagnalis TaxID=1503054 RepID=A0A6L3MSH5_9BURK|nr:hypothetical protein [Burkholderia stagnalis]KAB0635351.1 hypothetical protein F7R25_23250 [Burkholderia stagnalis]VWB70503.1 hypothetical protein BST28156_03349 [Burkholderia stagnalis]
MRQSKPSRPLPASKWAALTVALALASLAAPHACGAPGVPGGKRQPAQTALRPPAATEQTYLPDERSFRAIVKGMNTFAQNHELSPQGVLRFRLHARQPNIAMADIALSLTSNTTQAPLRVAPDLTFSVPREQAALDGDAILVTNKPAGSLAWRPEVRTPGLPGGSRRLGDLRLECLVDIDSDPSRPSELRRACLGSGAEATCLEEPGQCLAHAPAALGGFLLSSVVPLNEVKTAYEHEGFRYLFIADRPIFSVTLHHGGKQLVLPTTWLYGGLAMHNPFHDAPYLKDRFYELPLERSKWPDDTLVTFEYMDDA